MDKCLKSPFLCHFFVYRFRFAFMVAFVPNRVDFPFFSQSVCIRQPVVLICLICFASLHPFWSIVSYCLWFENRILNRFFAFRIRCVIYWIWDALAKIICESPIIVWCEKRNPMWWLNSIPASCAEIGCLVSHYCAIICACLICRLKSDVWSDNAYFIFA